MKFGPVLTYKDLDEAKRLIGKKVVAINTLLSIDDERDGQTYNECCLEKIVKSGYPFLMSDGCFYQFIREILPDKPEGSRYVPYDFSDPKVRDSLRGRWYRTKSGNEYQVTEFMAPNKFSDEWAFGGFCAATFLHSCTWLEDGTPCGKKVDDDPRA